jgi:putative serine protease PepD
VSHPRHIWAGDWRSESERARQAAAEAAAQAQTRSGTATAEGADTSQSQPAEQDRAHDEDREREREPTRRRPSGGVMALIALSVAGLLAGAFALGTLTSGNDGPAPLPSVSSSPIKPKKGQTQASAIYAAASPAVVSVRTTKGSGTGFLIDGSGTIVTNAHVAGANGRVVVKFGTDGAGLTARVRGEDPSSDLAVLHIDAAGIPKGVKPLQLADSRTVNVGDTAIAIGNPFGLDRTATEGIVSGVGRQIQSPNGFEIDSVIQTDAPINPGNSGGPLLDDAGHVIGVNSQIQTAGSGGNIGVGFAVPSNTVRQVAPQLERGQRIKHAYLGVQTSPPTPPNPSGAEIQSIVPGGPADKAKLRTGDVITRVDGQPVKDPTGVSTAISGRQPGDKVAIEVSRNGLTEEVTARLGNRPARTP